MTREPALPSLPEEEAVLLEVCVFSTTAKGDTVGLAIAIAVIANAGEGNRPKGEQ